MQRLLAAIVTGAILSNFGQGAMAAKYQCKGEGYEARVGTSPDRRVTIEHHRDKHLCLFSIDGWPASSPPTKAMQTAFQQLEAALQTPRGKTPPKLDIDTLANVLAAATPDQQVPSGLLAVLKEGAPIIHQCMTDFIRFQKQPPYPGIDKFPVACGAFGKGRHKIGGGIEFAFTERSEALVIVARVDGVVRALIAVYQPPK